MAEIRKENGKQMADGKELDFSSVQKLSDDALENVDGGIKIHTKSHWYGPDSLVGNMVSIMMGCTETVFYTMSVYFMSAHIRKTRWTLPGALAATAAGIAASIFLTGQLFHT